MPHFSYKFTVNAPQAVVSEFHHDTSALRQLSPPPIFAQLHDIEPLAEGSISDFTLWFGPVPVRWKAVHSAVSPAGFTDTQVKGPLKSWQHTHRFVPLDEYTTEVQESIQYAHPAGIRGLLTRLIFGWPGLWALFTYRQLVTRRVLESSSRPDQSPSRPQWPALLGFALVIIFVVFWKNRS